MRTKTEELTAIRDMVLEVEEFGNSAPHDTLVYRMFGSLTKDRAQGLVIGLNVAIRELSRSDNKV